MIYAVQNVIEACNRPHIYRPTQMNTTLILKPLISISYDKWKFQVLDLLHRYYM